jgi:tetratricopeptide (TPR) repeat protein
LGFTPLIYHLDNLLLHLAVTAGVFILAGRCGLSVSGAMAAALVFGLHPMHVQSVVWVTERKDVLYAFFYLAALLSYLSYLKQDKESKKTLDRPGDVEPVFASGRIFLYLTFFLGFLSALAKPMALSLPLMLFLLDGFTGRPFSRRSFWEKVAVSLLLAPVIWLTYALHMRSPQAVAVGQQTLWTWIWCLGFYLRKFFWPDEFTLFYKFPEPVSLVNPEFGPVLGIAVLGVVIWAFFRRHRFWSMAWCFYLGSIFFLLRFDTARDADVVADRFMYLPSVGFCLWLGDVYQRYQQRWQNVFSKRLALWLLTGCVLLPLAMKTYRQCDIWQNGVSLWRHQLDKEPRVASALVYHQLAAALMREPAFSRERDRQVEVFRLLQQALAIKPDYANAYYSLGDFFYRLGDMRYARIHFLKTVELDSFHFEAFFRLGEFYHQQGESERAVQAFRRAIAINPDNHRLATRVYMIYNGARQKAAYPPVYETETLRLEQVYHLRGDETLQ